MNTELVKLAFAAKAALRSKYAGTSQSSGASSGVDIDWQGLKDKAENSQFAPTLGNALLYGGGGGAIGYGLGGVTGISGEARRLHNQINRLESALPEKVRGAMQMEFGNKLNGPQRAVADRLERGQKFMELNPKLLQRFSRSAVDLGNIRRMANMHGLAGVGSGIGALGGMWILDTLLGKNKKK